MASQSATACQPFFCYFFILQCLKLCAQCSDAPFRGLRQELSQQRFSDRLQPVEQRPRLGRIPLWKISITEFLVRMFQSVSDRFTHADTASAMCGGAPQQL